MNTAADRRSGRGWAYTFTVLGGLVSIAANIAHSYVPPTGAPADWAPQPGAVLGAIVWPVFLFGAVELLARVAWPDGVRWQLLRFGGMTPVAVVAALVSYRHLSGLLAFYGEDAVTCLLGPIAVDGLMVMATGAIIATGHTKDTTDPVPVAAVPDLTDVPALTPAAPTRTIAPTVTADDPGPATTPATPGAVPVVRTDVPTPAHVASRIVPDPATIPLRSTAPRAAAGGSKPKPRTSVTTPTAATLAVPAADFPVTEPEPAQLSLPLPVAPDLLAEARETATQYRTDHGMPINAGQLAARLRVNSDVAAQTLRVLDLGPDSPATPVPTVNGTPVQASR